MNRRSFLLTGAAAAAALSTADAARAQTRTARLIIPLAPGGATDPYGRLVVEHMGRTLGRTFIVEHKPGGTGIVGSQYVIDQPADGNLLLLSTQSMMEIIPNAQRDVRWSVDSFI